MLTLKIALIYDTLYSNITKSNDTGFFINAFVSLLRFKFHALIFELFYMCVKSIFGLVYKNVIINNSIFQCNKSLPFKILRCVKHARS